MRIKIIAFLIVLVSITVPAWSQTVVVTDDNTYLTGNTSSVLDIKSDSKGVLVPRMTSAQRTAITTPATGLLVYQTNGTTEFYFYNGSAWTAIVSGTTSQWQTSGNTGSTAANFLGTTDNVSLRVRTNNTQRVIVDSVGQVGIGTSIPTSTLHITGTSPLKVFGLAAGTSTDSVLTIVNGVVKKLPMGNGTAGLWSLTGNAATTPAASFMGTTDNVSLRFRTNNTQKMILDSVGQVGIGVDAPTASLHIVGTTPLKLYGLPAGDNSDSVLTVDGGTVQKISISAGSNGLWSLKGNASTIPSTNFIGTTDNLSMRFRTNNTQRAIIDSVGQVGIGTAAPTATLDVAGTVKLGTSGTKFTNIIKTSVTITNTTNINNTAAFQFVTATVTGAQLNASVIVNPRANLTQDIFVAYAYISATNTITIAFGNTSTSNRSVGSSKVFDVTVINP